MRFTFSILARRDVAILARREGRQLRRCSSAAFEEVEADKGQSVVHRTSMQLLSVVGTLPLLMLTALGIFLWMESWAGTCGGKIAG